MRRSSDVRLAVLARVVLPRSVPAPRLRGGRGTPADGGDQGNHAAHDSGAVYVRR